MTDRYTIHSQLEHLQSKYIGTGHADTTKWEWLVNQHRDSYCSYMGHFDLLNYFAIAENEISKLAPQPAAALCSRVRGFGSALRRNPL